VLAAENGKQDDYTQLLPLFLYGDNAVAQTVSGDMSVAAQKATKAINYHSITAKPKMGKSGMTPVEKKFYDKHEFNKYIDDCYLLIGKTYLYVNEYNLALKTFNYMESEFAGDPILYESRIWKARSLTLDKNYRESEMLLDELSADEAFPDKKVLKSELEATIADLHIKRQDYGNAVIHLETALKYTKQKKTKMRYHFVLAQLYLAQKNFDGASANFQKVVEMHPPYEMAFNATISMATSAKGTNTNEVRKNLEKMLHDSKNIEYHDRIYYALAELEMTEGNTQKAIEYYAKSAAVSTNNLSQKTQSYLTLANLYYNRRNYPPAQAYYDSAMMNMQPDYPNYVQIAAKTKNLNALVENLNTIQRQDSLQRIARMTEQDRNTLIDKIIENLREEERSKSEKEAVQMQQYYSSLGRQSTSPDARAKAQWYFYNPATVSQGITEFQTKWGKRALEDNWRRKNKGAAMDMGMVEISPDQEEQEEKIVDTDKRDYYLQYLPITDSLMNVSHRMILEALYFSGYIYNSDFGEYKLAVAQYEELLRRYPQSPYAEAACYYLYLLYTQLGDGAAAEKNKNILLTRAPESVFAKILRDPSYLDKLAREQGEVAILYEQVYLIYTEGLYEQTISAATSAIERHPQDELTPKFAYLRALSAGRIGTQETLRAEMKKITEEYPDNEVAVAAQEIIDFIDGIDPSLKKAEQTERVKSLYTSGETGIHYFVWIVDAKEDINQLSFDLLNFNLDHYMNTKLELTRTVLDDKQTFLMVKSFADRTAAQDYYRSFEKNAGVKKNAKNQPVAVIISEHNFQILETDKKTDDYIEFFKKEYPPANAE
jgi:tetratricopeptide (TPR) repeat protein